MDFIRRSNHLTGARKSEQTRRKLWQAPKEMHPTMVVNRLFSRFKQMPPVTVSSAVAMGAWAGHFSTAARHCGSRGLDLHDKPCHRRRDQARKIGALRDTRQTSPNVSSLVPDQATASRFSFAAEAIGSSTVNSAPDLSALLAALIVPPIASTKPRQIASPSPVPAR